MNVFVNVSGTQETLGDRYVQENLWKNQEENKELPYILPLVTFGWFSLDFFSYGQSHTKKQKHIHIKSKIMP